MAGFERLWSWRKPDVEFATTLSVEECQERLTKALHYKRGLLGFQTDNPAIGRVRGNDFYLSKTPSFWYRNDFRPFLYGKLIATPQGAYVQASFRPHTAIILIYSIGSVAFAILYCNDAGKNLAAQTPWWWILSFPILAFGVIALPAWLFWQSSRSDKTFLAAYLQQALLTLPSNPQA